MKKWKMCLPRRSLPTLKYVNKKISERLYALYKIRINLPFSAFYALLKVFLILAHFLFKDPPNPMPQMRQFDIDGCMDRLI